MVDSSELASVRPTSSMMVVSVFVKSLNVPSGLVESPNDGVWRFPVSLDLNESL